MKYVSFPWLHRRGAPVSRHRRSGGLTASVAGQQGALEPFAFDVYAPVGPCSPCRADLQGLGDKERERVPQRVSMDCGGRGLVGKKLKWALGGMCQHRLYLKKQTGGKSKKIQEIERLDLELSHSSFFQICLSLGGKYSTRPFPVRLTLLLLLSLTTIDPNVC